MPAHVKCNSAGQLLPHQIWKPSRVSYSFCLLGSYQIGIYRVNLFMWRNFEVQLLRVGSSQQFVWQYRCHRQVALSVDVRANGPPAYISCASWHFGLCFSIFRSTWRIIFQVDQYYLAMANRGLANVLESWTNHIWRVKAASQTRQLTCYLNRVWDFQRGGIN